ncbi:MAG TPA: phosphatidylserine decarboxylase family protein [Chitinophagaceae bacterium]|nr:phosphatidylserine decarboxylase family protein [Chitinophagaceae bacterium]
MSIHKEGFATLIIVGFLVACINALIRFIAPDLVFYIVLAVSVAFYIFLMSFFRNPTRKYSYDDKLIISPCDGKVVVIEKTIEHEYFKDERIQISIFMSPLNVHINRNPVSGIVKYVKYHPGLYLVAWHPKSSTENERNTVVYETANHQILIRQIAGKVARKISCYLSPNKVVRQNDEMGFI